MTFDLWLGYLAVASLAIISPGPAIILALNYGVRFGGRAVLASSLGNITGLGILAAAAAGGMGALLAQGGWVAEALHWLGGGYLVFLGVKLWRSKPPEAQEPMGMMPSAGRRYLVALGTALTNPKAMAFFAAIFPLFVRTEADLAPQFAILAGTFMGLSLTCLMVCGYSAGHLRRWLLDPKVGRAVNRTSGTVMIVFGAALALRR
ncbi:LysE family translocator [Lacibacterium aquatile]|uniref:LysE family translocator n=1 Tax=Lacibacterium aquatile TaxID=1168082 RepID=A0ABW5DU71_9PROT